MRTWTYCCLLLTACSSHGVRCDAHLQPINQPARVAAPASGSLGAAAKPTDPVAPPARRSSP